MATNRLMGVVVVKLNLTLWDAIKIRITGKQAQLFLDDIKRQLQLMVDASVADSVDRMRSRESGE